MTLHLDGPCGSEICPFCRWYRMPADPCPWPRIDLFPRTAGALRRLVGWQDQIAREREDHLARNLHTLRRGRV